MYSRPSAISGVFCDAMGGVISVPSRIASGITDCRQTISRSWMVSALI